MWILPSTLCPSVLDSAASTSESDSLFLMLEQSFSWRGKSLPAQSWRRLWKRVPYMRHLLGPTLRLSTENRGVGEFIASLEDFHANHSPLLENAKEIKTSDMSGQASFVSSKKCLPPWSSLKTCQPSLAGFDLSENDYASWGTGLRLDSSARLSVAPRRSANDSSVSGWQTPGTDSFRQRGGDRADEMGLDQQARYWRTPDAPGSSGGPRNRQGSIGDGHQVTIAEQAEHWPTPWANDHKGSAKVGQRRGQLDEAAEQKFIHIGHQDRPTTESGNPSLSDGPNSPLLWPTPLVDMESGPNNHYRGDPKAGRQLQTEAERWATPSASMMSPEDMEQARFSSSDPRRPEYKDAHQVGAHPGGKRKLNPNFVGWLQGLPLGWASGEPISFEVWVTWRFRSRQLLRFLLLPRS